MGNKNHTKNMRNITETKQEKVKKHAAVFSKLICLRKFDVLKGCRHTKIDSVSAIFSESDSYSYSFTANTWVFRLIFLLLS